MRVFSDGSIFLEALHFRLVENHDERLQSGSCGRHYRAVYKHGTDKKAQISGFQMSPACFKDGQEEFQIYNPTIHVPHGIWLAVTDQ